MSARDSSRRASGDNRAVVLNGGGQFLAANIMRLRSVAVSSAISGGTTVDVQVNGSSVLAQANAEETLAAGVGTPTGAAVTGAVPQNTPTRYDFGGGVVVQAGQTFKVTSSDNAALITADFLAA